MSQKHMKTIIGLAINNMHIQCSLMSSLNSLLSVQAYEEYPIDYYMLYNITIFNSTALAKLLFKFIKNHAIHNPAIVISLEDHYNSNLYELLGLQQSVISDDTLNNYYWGQQEFIIGNNHVSYKCGIPHTVLLQYILFGIISQLTLVALVPKTVSWYYAHAWYAPTATLKHTISDYSLDSLKNFFHTTAQYSYLSSIKQGKYTTMPTEALLTALGLYTIGKV
jgi:hypothetical protein